MKHFWLLLLYSLLWLCGFSQKAPLLKLWYRQPAKAAVAINTGNDNAEWLKALPLGNGSLGAMVFGDVHQERIQLNEKTLWSGGPDDNDNPDAAPYLGKIRELLVANRYKEATALTNETQVCKGAGSGNGNGAKFPYGCYQTLGDLWIDFESKAPYSDYRRELDIDEAIARIHYRQNGIVFNREIFVSHPAQALVIRFTASRKGRLSFSCRLDRPERFATVVERDQLVMQGALMNGKGGEGMRYMARLSAKAVGGKAFFSNDKLVVQHADEVILYLAAATDYLPVYPRYSGKDYGSLTQQRLVRARALGFKQIKKEHLTDYRHFFSRVNLQLTNAIDTVATDERVKRYRTRPADLHLEQLYFQYGRYLLIASSREDNLPANLQGIWANQIQTPWNADYHTNINVQMNYWPAEVTNLSELHLPLIQFIKDIEQPATRSARIQFHAGGWCVNPIVNIWGFTAPGEHPSWGLTPGATGWLCQHLWEHYVFTMDSLYLKSVYPTLKNAARFYLDWLVKDTASGTLVSGPSSSPENSFTAPDGSVGTISMGPSHDQQIIQELFTNVLTAGSLLHDTDPILATIRQAKGRLLLTKIGDDGRIMEWARPFLEREPGHRHFSHLYALYPGYAFNETETPAFIDAAQKSLEVRLENGGAQTGWSAAWAINLWARLKGGEGALKALQSILSRKTADNLFDLHPPFQIDGNFGATAGIAEMLLKSQAGSIELLPALPTAWAEGHVKGLVARGGFVLDMEWRNHFLSKTSIYSKRGGRCRVRYKNRIIEVQVAAGEKQVLSFE